MQQMKSNSFEEKMMKTRKAAKQKQLREHNNNNYTSPSRHQDFKDHENDDIIIEKEVPYQVNS